MMRKLCTPLLILMLIGALVIGFMYSAAQIPSAPGTLVKLAEIPPYCAEDILYHDYWNDFLQYTDGHEIFIFRTKSNLTSQLDQWTHVASVTLDEIQAIVPIELHHRFFQEISSDLPDSYTAYFLNTTFSGDEAAWKDEALWNDEYIIGLYDAKTRICVIYRGHHFYGF